MRCTFTERDQADTLVLCDQAGRPCQVGGVHTVRCEEHWPGWNARHERRLRAAEAVLIAAALLAALGYGWVILTIFGD